MIRKATRFVAIQCMIDLIIKNGLLSQEDVQKRVKYKLNKLSTWSDMT